MPKTIKAFALPRVSEAEVVRVTSGLGLRIPKNGFHLEGEGGRFNVFLTVDPESKVPLEVALRCLKSWLQPRKTVSLSTEYSVPRDYFFRQKSSVLLLLAVPRDQEAVQRRSCEGISKFVLQKVYAETGLRVKSIALYSHGAHEVQRYGVEFATSAEADIALGSVGDRIFDGEVFGDWLLYAVQKTVKTKHFNTPETDCTKGYLELPDDIQLAMSQFC